MRIECPDCSQRFDVTDEFMDKTVECGSCDNRFKVGEDVLVTEKKKFYPGEKQDSHLERFASSGASAVAGAMSQSNVGFEQAHYQANVDIEQVGPPRPRRTLAAIAGVSLMLMVIIVFLLAGGKEGAMRDMETMNRYVLVGFVALLGCVLVLYGMAKNRLVGVLTCFIFGGGLLVMPLLFPGNPTSASEEVVSALPPVQRVIAKDKEEEEKDYLSEIGYSPVEEALEQHPGKSVVAIYIRNAPQIVRDKIADYLYEETGKLHRGISYVRGDMRDSGLYGLILMKNQQMSITEIAALCGRFGMVNKIHEELRVIDVTVQNSKVIKLDPEQSLDPNNQGFYSQQLVALRSFDPAVKMKAVVRLGNSEPKARRDDVTKALLAMLPNSKTELKLEIVRTLQVWSIVGDGAGPIVLEAVKELHQENRVSRIAMTFLVERKVDGAELVLMDLWTKDPVRWSDLLISLGEGAQVLLLPGLEKMDAVHVVSASDILGKVGSKACIPYLEEVIEKQEEIGQKSLKAAIDEIKKRS